MITTFEEKIENCIKEAEQAIEKLDKHEIKEEEALAIFNSANNQIDECINSLSKENFVIEEIQLRKRQ